MHKVTCRLFYIAQLLAIALLSLLFFVGIQPAYAQSSTNSNTANSGSESYSQSGSVANTSNAMTVVNSTPERQTVEYTGDYKVRTAPGTVLGGFSGSFASDYCLGTAQAGASGLGWSLAGGKPVADPNCQKLRRVERFGQLAATAGGDTTPNGRKLLSMATWEICTTDPVTTKACKELGLVIDEDLPKVYNPQPVQP